MSFETGDSPSADEESCGVQAFLTFGSSIDEVQQCGGYDGWVMLVREDFDTEDLAWPHEHARLDGIASRALRRLEAAGVRVGDLSIGVAFSLLMEPPDRDEEEERLWCIEYFAEDYDLVVCPACRARPSRRARLGPSAASPVAPATPITSPPPSHSFAKHAALPPQTDEAELAERLLAVQQLVLPQRADEPTHAASADVDARQLGKLQPPTVVAPAPASPVKAVTPLALTRTPHDFDDIEASLDEHALRSVGAA